MKKLIENFPKQLEEAIAIGQKTNIDHHNFEPETILICGMGGSGIGGSILVDLLNKVLKKPILISKNYSLPAFANENTLTVFCSYSGNTEETLNAMREGIQKNCKIVCVTSGGDMSRICLENKIPYYIIPGGMPPRACLGYSLIQLFYILYEFGLIENDFKNQILSSSFLLNSQIESIKKDAFDIAKFLFEKKIIIYSTELNQSVAIRFKQQLNENSKLHAHCENIPEMNHNELVAWRKFDDNIAVLFLRDIDEHPRNTLRIKLNEIEIKKCTPHCKHIFAVGENQIEKTIYLIHLLDWVSLYLAELNKVDPSEIDVLNNLKNCLSIN
jgi:glucose/mannose-6-phosphate isomerase